MHIVFLSELFGAASCEYRTSVPALWINKYTQHTASAYDKKMWAQHGFWDSLKPADVIVVHTPLQEYVSPLIAIKKAAPEKLILLDMDDYYDEQFEQFHLGGWMRGRKEVLGQLADIVDGFIVASKSLYAIWTSRTDKPVVYIDNGFDLQLPFNHAPKTGYAPGVPKVVWGGGLSHYRDIEMFVKFGVLERLLQEVEFDMFFYPLVKGMEEEKAFFNGIVHSRNAEAFDRYIHSLYRDAAFSVAPLVTETLDYNTRELIPDKLNHCRSSLKLVEAGVARMPAIASATESYTAYEGGVTIVCNNAKAWYDAMRVYLENPDKRKADGEENRSIVEQYYDAPILTQKRISFIEELL